ncbi:hypothetical protein KAR52_01895 [Candidatus Pacearchaeota archaeon]|nr:hypothetical protein [Candidatus Pacearchaeota archaeon]
MEKTEKIKIKVKRLEEGLENSLKVIFESKFGEYPLEVEKEKFDLFCPGKKYSGIFRVSGMPDFIGDKDRWENVCTVSYVLEKILDDKKVVYENE